MPPKKAKPAAAILPLENPMKAASVVTAGATSYTFGPGTGAIDDWTTGSWDLVSLPTNGTPANFDSLAPGDAVATIAIPAGSLGDGDGIGFRVAVDHDSGTHQFSNVLMRAADVIYWFSDITGTSAMLTENSTTGDYAAQTLRTCRRNPSRRMGVCSL